MKQGAQSHYLAETIAEVTNLAILEIYRGQLTFSEARLLDTHMTALSMSIIDAISEVPEPDEYEDWLREKIYPRPEECNFPAPPPDYVAINGRWHLANTVRTVKFTDIFPEQPVSGPPTEQEITPPSPAGAAEELPGAPISGDAPALFNESNECITTTVQQQAPTGPDVDDATGSPGRGGEPAALTNTREGRTPIETMKSVDVPVPNRNGSPVDGGGPSTQDTHQEPESTAESNAEGQTTKDDAGSCGPASAGKPERHPIAELIEKWKTENNASNMELQRRSGVSNGLISMILNGKALNPAPATRKKLNKVIKPKKKRAAAEPKTNGSAPASNGNGKGPGQFVSMKLLAWMGRERLGNAQAAERLEINESVIRQIQNGLLPHSNILRVLARHVPDIRTNLGFLLQQAERVASS